MAGAAQPERPDFLQYWHCRPQEQSGMPFLCKKTVNLSVPPQSPRCPNPVHGI